MPRASVRALAAPAHGDPGVQRGGSGDRRHAETHQVPQLQVLLQQRGFSPGPRLVEIAGMRDVGMRGCRDEGAGCGDAG